MESVKLCVCAVFVAFFLFTFSIASNDTLSNSTADGDNLNITFPDTNETLLDSGTVTNYTFPDTKDTYSDSEETVSDSKDIVLDSKDTVFDSKDTVSDEKDSFLDSKDTLSDSRTIFDSGVDNDGDSEVVSDTDEGVMDPSELTPEDEDMTIMKIEKLGGLLDSKDIADIEDEEQTLEDVGDVKVSESVEDTDTGDDPEDLPEDILKFEPIPMPTDFDSYDRDRNGFIEIDELIEVTGAFENVRDAFKVCDTNDDGHINREEFEEAPWDLAGKPPDVLMEEYD